MDVVPRIMVTGGNAGEGGSTTGSIMEALLTMLLSDRYSAMTGETVQSPRSPEAEALRAQIRKDIEKKSMPGEAKSKE